MLNIAKNKITIALAVGLVALMGLLLAAAQQGPSAKRSFSSPSVGAGGEVTVTIAVSNYGGFGRITETLPDGFVYVSSSLDDSQVDATGVDATGRQVVKFTLQAETSFTYTVTAPSMAGTYDFNSPRSAQRFRQEQLCRRRRRRRHGPAPSGAGCAILLTRAGCTGWECDGQDHRCQLWRFRTRHRDVACRVHLRFQQPGRQPGGCQRRSGGQVHPAVGHLIYLHRHRAGLDRNLHLLGGIQGQRPQ